MTQLNQYQTVLDLERQDLTVLGIKAKDLIPGLISLVIGAVIALQFTFLPVDLRIVVFVLSALIAAWFAWFDGLHQSVVIFRFLFGIRHAALQDPALEKYVGIKDIKNDMIYEHSGNLSAVIRVFPRDIEVLGDNDLHALLSHFSSWLNSLTFPVSITIRTALLSLDDYLEKTKENVVTIDNPIYKSYVHNYFRFWHNYTKQKTVKNRQFYLSVGAGKAGSDFSLTGFLSRQEIAEENYEEELQHRVSLLLRALEDQGYDAYRLDTSQLVTYCASIFEGDKERDGQYDQPISFGEHVRGAA